MQDKLDDAEKANAQQKVICESARNEGSKYKKKLSEKDKELQALNK